MDQSSEYHASMKMSCPIVQHVDRNTICYL